MPGYSVGRQVPGEDQSRAVRALGGGHVHRWRTAVAHHRHHSVGLGVLGAVPAPQARERILTCGDLQRLVVVGLADPDLEHLTSHGLRDLAQLSDDGFQKLCCYLHVTRNCKEAAYADQVSPVAERSVRPGSA